MKTRRWVGWLCVIASACGEPQAGSEGADGGSEGGEGSDDGEPAPPVAEEDYAATLADLLCDLQAECTCEDPLPEAECRSMFETAITSSSAPPPDSGLVFDPQCAGEVIAEWTELGCGSILEMPQPDVCDPCPLYRGSRELGEACTEYSDGMYDDCDRGLRCNTDGVCDEPCATVGEGENCNGKTCEPGLYCQYVDPDPEEHGNEPVGTCRPAAKLGEACNIELECDAGLVCSYSNECIEWDGAEVGEPCMYGCVEGLICSGEPSYECRPKAAVGEPCYAPGDCASGRCHSGMLVCQEEQAAACFG